MTDKECHRRLREYLLVPETQETVKRMDARKLPSSHRLAVFLIKKLLSNGVEGPKRRL